ncbi:MAG: amidohydrolase family protein [Parcubacteria group bacterium]|nr:amidohydrolase family protein [Parcubacteria group bacterium]MCR4342327.1 amidohydrolase family protein [Patescibacteria group bacterium]
MAYYSILIKNGTVFDGKGNTGVKTDIGISGDEIKKIGNLSGATADEVINAEGKYVCPGFIDTTAHSDTHFTLFSSPRQESFFRQGVTTIVGGNCGSSLAPLLSKDATESLAKWTDISKINVNWRTVGEMLNELDNHRLGVNFCTLAGFDTLYKSIVGESIEINDDILKQLKLVLRNSIKEGAFGLSASLSAESISQIGDDNFIEILKEAEDRGALVKHHLEDEGKNILPSLSKVLHLARNSGARTQISHFKALGRSAWSVWPQSLEMIRTAREDGVDIICDFFPYTRTGSSLFDFLPLWIKKEGREKILKILRAHDSNERKDLLTYLKSLTLHYDRITIASTLHDFSSVGKTIESLALESGLSGEEVILNLLEVNNLHVSIFSEVISEKNIEDLAKEDYSMVASDGVGYDVSSNTSEIMKDLAHPRSFGAFPRFLNTFAKKGIISWEQAIYKMTALPAKALGLKDRGAIAKGNYADIVIFDPEEIEDQSTYDAPYRLPLGIERVLINGKSSFEMAGRVLRYR